MTLPLLTGSIGVVASCVLMLFSVVIPRWFVSDAVQHVDVFRFGNRVFSKTESRLFGILVYFIFSLFFGVLFGVGMDFHVLDVDFYSLGVYFVVISLILGGIVLPLEGHGLFGWKEDHWIPVDLLAMNAIWIFIFWALLVVLV
jgi:hypothetical protein